MYYNPAVIPTTALASSVPVAAKPQNSTAFERELRGLLFLRQDHDGTVRRRFFEALELRRGAVSHLFNVVLGQQAGQASPWNAKA